MIIRAKTTTITSTERARHAVCSRRLALAVLSVAVTLGASAACARTQVSIHGDRAVVQLEASNAPLAEVLSALERAFSIGYRTSVPLDQSISGTYRGPLRQVLSRLLDGFSYYVAETADGGMEITVIGRRVVGNLPSVTPQVVTPFQKLEVPPPTMAEVAAERQRAHHRRPPQQP
jgi:hypothetical protein